ncbi:uncharacterized protein E0L32_005751 [Thyridium curvatum]|uniref:dual-specificity kinase n=1 Tax=Thyridium curvatum TaxID=1093900 RepID=A0A507B252_9PEZI|nr:uncharacterized protein E0L32_005751 [Thyridium curvatum]TPX13807.1 hypothetical protein E0L32_005751 [Thyridium curvatum]
MSTPTTATATLPPHHHPGYPFNTHHQTTYPANSSAFRTTNLPASARLAPAYPYPITSSPSSNNYAGANGLNSPATAARSLHNKEASNYTTTAMPVTAQAPPAEPQPVRKRRRSREPDWHNFYKNGLPKEIIVIDDTPEPEPARTASAPKPLTNGHAANGTGHHAIPVDDSTTAHHVSKKRRRDDEATHYDPVHNRIVSSHTYDTASGSTVSSDRTSSAAHTTAPTSLSSNGQYDYEVPSGQKRKRTRQQIANEAKKQELSILGQAFAAYQPPPHPPKKAGDVPVRVIHDSTHSKGSKVDDEDGHYIVIPDADLTDKYQMIKLLGQGTFGKVVQAKDRRRNELVAIKIIRSVQKYRDASKIELRVLATLKANDAENRNRCIHLRDCFDFRGHICIVMDLLGQSVFDFLKGNNFVPFPNSQIQNFARQLFTSVAFLHDLNLIHTDLKPENILLASSEYQTFTYNRKIPSSSATVARQATQRRVLLDTEIRLIDFGSATFQDEYHSSVVSTRHYRAPEIILGLGWSYPCDIWSIGCILVEFFTGDALFQTHDNLEHLAMMEAVCDARIDPHLVHSVNKMTRNGGNPAAKYFKRTKLDYPTAETTRASRRFVKAMKKLHEIIPSNNNFLRQFLDLLKKIFVYDPAHRITAKQALQHPWFKENAHPDDGTEAAKIRQEKRSKQAKERIAARIPPYKADMP